VPAACDRAGTAGLSVAPGAHVWPLTWHLAGHAPLMALKAVGHEGEVLPYIRPRGKGYEEPHLLRCTGKALHMSLRITGLGSLRTLDRPVPPREPDTPPTLRI
jgi:hypothetical protein